MIFTLCRAIACSVCIALIMAGKPSPALSSDSILRPFPAQYTQPQIYQAALNNAQGIPPLSSKITGLTIPHHLLAVELMASALALVRDQTYERIIILSPNHFHRGQTFFSVSIRPFSTCLGPVSIDIQATQQVLNNPQVSSSNLFSHEHGVQALLPLLAHYFPQVPVLAITMHLAAKKKDWDALMHTLLPLVSKDTLIIQSTDFSHYLTWPQAIIHDQETLHALALGRADDINLLDQPAHLDSKAAQYLQIKLQDLVCNATPTVIANANSCEFAAPQEPLPQETTSYIVQVYSPERLPSINLSTRGAPKARYFFGGDFFTGRYLTHHLANPAKRQKFLDQILNLTQGAPLILNFEGVLATQCPPQDLETLSSGQTLPPEKWQLCMPKALTLEILKALNVVAVGLANNHSHDHGPQGYDQTKKTLEEHGIMVVESGQITSLPDFNLVAWTDVDNNHPQKRDLLTTDELTILPEMQTHKPLWALMHWGQEGWPKPKLREKLLFEQLQHQGFSLIVGHHSHRAGELQGNTQGVVAWSLGNFLFDQPEPMADGALLEVSIFPQGTFWVRQIHLGNLYAQCFKH